MTKKTSRRESLKWIGVSKLVTLSRNPQYLTPKQMDSLKRSIERDGFLVPILIRPIRGGKYEVVSGNHRFLAANELGMESVPCVIVSLRDQQAKKIAVNLNTIHGEPNAELMAPFLADLDDESLRDIHLDPMMLDDIEKFDGELRAKLDALAIPEGIDRASTMTSITRCRCEKCGKDHIANGL